MVKTNDDKDGEARQVASVQNIKTLEDERVHSINKNKCSCTSVEHTAPSFHDKSRNAQDNMGNQENSFQVVVTAQVIHKQCQLPNISSTVIQTNMVHVQGSCQNCVKPPQVSSIVKIPPSSDRTETKTTKFSCNKRSKCMKIALGILLLTCIGSVAGLAYFLVANQLQSRNNSSGTTTTTSSYFYGYGDYDEIEDTTPEPYKFQGQCGQLQTDSSHRQARSTYSIADGFSPDLLLRLSGGSDQPSNNTEKPLGRVLNGKSIKISDAPWQVSIWGLHYGEDQYVLICGGIIVSERWILTAAHCLYYFERLDKVVVLPGTSKLPVELFNKRDYIIPVVSAHCHEEYIDDGSYDFDICMAKLERKIEYNGKQLPICLPPQNQNYENGMEVSVTGWGALNEDLTEYPDNLQKADVQVISNSICNRQDWLDHRVTDRMICAGLPEGGKDSCALDSGGPLYKFDVNTLSWTLVGIVSFGYSCGQAKSPGVYTKVSRFTNWISDITERDSYI